MNARAVVSLVSACSLLSVNLLAEDRPVSKSAELTEEECNTAAKKLEQSLRAGEGTALREMWDPDAAVDKAISGLKISKGAETEFRNGIRKSNEQGNGVLKLVQAGKSFKLLRIHKVDGKMRALFRLLPASGGFNYTDMVFAADRDRHVRIVDLYGFILGEMVSDSYRRGALELAALENKGLVAKLTGWQSEFVKNLPNMKAMQSSFASGKYKEAYQIFRKLPPALQKEKFVLVQAVAIAQKVGEAEYQKVLDELMKAHPKDPALAILSIDAYFLKKKYDDALKSIETLDAIVNGDPYLHALRANVLLESGKLAEARVEAQKCIDHEPNLLDPHWTLVTAALKEKDFKETARILTKLEKELGVKISDLTKSEVYAEFVKSPEYKAWMKSRTKAAG